MKSKTKKMHNMYMLLLTIELPINPIKRVIAGDLYNHSNSIALIDTIDTNKVNHYWNFLHVPIIQSLLTQ